MPDQAPVDRSQQYPEFVREFARAVRAGDTPPAALAEWEERKRVIRKRLLAAWGGFPEEMCPLEPRVLGELKRDGYRVEKVVFQTRLGVLMTANAYVPESGTGGQGLGAGEDKTKVSSEVSGVRTPAPKFAAVLCVHGHWRGAKQDPVVQARCIGLAKLGFFVLCVDAFGAGERGISKNLGEYHGEMVAATLLPVGLPLSGLQVYENMRAVDYLQSRPEVDGAKLGITGASGGGNQSMYAGAFDERFTAVVPVCSVGTYQSYLRAACCLCEVVPGALSFTEEAGILALVAPRALMVVNATRDGIQFSVGEAQKSLAAARPAFELHGKGENLKHAVFESPHDYSQAMRETMYGWMTLHLKGEGDGSPIAEPKIVTENPEDLRCYPGDSRPDDYVTIPKFAAAEGRKRVAKHKVPDHLEHWEANRMALRHVLERDVLGGFPKRTDLKATLVATAASKDADPRRRSQLTFQSEPRVELSGRVDQAEKGSRLAIILDLDRGDAVIDDPLVQELRKKDWNLAIPELRATATSAIKGDVVGRAKDHNSAEWGLWLGRPLLGQWTWDVIRLLDALHDTNVAPGKPVTLIGFGPAGIVALVAAACDPRVAQTVCVKSLASYLSEEPYAGQRLGIMAPHIVPKAGDIPQLVSLILPRKVHLDGPVQGNGEPLPAEKLAAAFQHALLVAALLKSPGALVVSPASDPARLAKRLSE